MLTGDVTDDDGVFPFVKKFFYTPRHGDAIADFCLWKKTSLCVRTIAIPSQGKTNKPQAGVSTLPRSLQYRNSVKRDNSKSLCFVELLTIPCSIQDIRFEIAFSVSRRFSSRYFCIESSATRFLWASIIFSARDSIIFGVFITLFIVSETIFSRTSFL